MLVSIIIPTFNNRALIEQCLTSLNNHHVFCDEVEVIVVDNGSQDNTVKFVQESFPFVKVIEFEKNCGFGKAIHTGVSHAKGKYVALLNNDTIVGENWLHPLVEVAESDGTIGAVCSKTFLNASNKIQNAGLVLFKQGYGRDRGALVNAEEKKQDYEQDSDYFNLQSEVQAFSGVSVLLRKDLYEKLGGFDPLFFMYYEDVDLSIRMRLAGFKIVYEPKSTVYHLHSGSSQENSPFFLRHSERSRLIYLLKYFPCLIVIRELVYIVLQVFNSMRRGGYRTARVRINNLLWIFFYALAIVQSRIGVKKNSLSFKQIFKEMY